MWRIAVFSSVALLGCKRHDGPRDARIPQPGPSRGSFALTYYWPDVPPTDGTWGSGVADRPLVPYRSIAVDRSVIPIGTHLWLEELAHVAAPDGAAIDGCVVADDIGGKIIGAKIDLFVPDEAAYKALDHALDLTSVTVRDGGERCP